MSLTTGIDTISITGSGADTVIGLQQAADGTWNSGDTISGNGKTNISLIGNAAAASVVTASNIASINVNLVQTSGLNATQFTNVAQVAVTNGVAAQSLVVTAANVTTTYAINQARATTIDLNTFSSTITGTADAVQLSVTGAGAKISEAGTFDLGGNAIEVVNLATSGTNFVAFADAASVTTVNISGAGTNNVNVGALYTSDLVVTGGTGADTITAAPAAGTTAATLTGVETVDVDFANANTYVSGVNWTGVTKVQANAASDETMTFTALKSTVATAVIGSTASTNADNVALTYVSGSTGDLELRIGAATADVDVGTITVTNKTGAFNINSIGKVTYGDATATTVTNAKATSVNVASVTSGLDISTALVAAVASSFSLSAVAGLTTDVNRIDIGKTGSDLTVTNVTLSATGLNSDGDTGSTVVTNLNVVDHAAADVVVVDQVTLISDVDGLVSFTATQAGATADNVTISVVNATGAAGDGVVIDLSDIDSDGSSVSTGAGTATVSLTANDDTFVAGSGAATVSTIGGTDDITLGAGRDTVIISTVADGSTVNSFTVGTSKDILAIDQTTWAAMDGDGNVEAAGTTVVALTIASTATAATLTAAQNLVVMTGIIADNAALETLIDGLAWTFAGTATDADTFAFAYFDGADTNIVKVELTDDAAHDWTVDAGVGATLVGISTADLLTTNFAFAA